MLDEYWAFFEGVAAVDASGKPVADRFYGGMDDPEQEDDFDDEGFWSIACSGGEKRMPSHPTLKRSAFSVLTAVASSRGAARPQPWAR